MFDAASNRLEENAQTQGRAVPAPLAQKQMEGPLARAVKQVVGEEPFPTLAVPWFLPDAPSSRRGTPPVAVVAAGLLAKRRVLSFERRSRSFSMDQHHLKSSGVRLALTHCMQLPQGACLASGGGGRWGRDQRHGESKSGSRPQLSDHRPRSGPCCLCLSQGCGDGTSLRLRFLFQPIQRCAEDQRRLLV